MYKERTSSYCLCWHFFLHFNVDGPQKHNTTKSIHGQETTDDFYNLSYTVLYRYSGNMFEDKIHKRPRKEKKDVICFILFYQLT